MLQSLFRLLRYRQGRNKRKGMFLANFVRKGLHPKEINTKAQWKLKRQENSNTVTIVLKKSKKKLR